jgi:predicted nuclease of predicted toxin-antitoxin system
VNRFLWDENTSHDILRALRSIVPDAEVLVVQESVYAGAPDEMVIQLAIEQNRVIVTGDRNTLIGAAASAMRGGKTLPGVVVVGSGRLSPGEAAEQLALLAVAAAPDELTNRITFLPLS